jgi:hypothetical protein
MAKTIAEKLMIKPNTTVWLSHARHLPLLTPMPDGVREVGTMATASTAVVFVDDATSACEILAAHADELALPGVFWVAYPKGNRADVNRDSLWPILAEFGMRPNGQVAVDNTWSAMRFRTSKPDEAPFQPDAN